MDNSILILTALMEVGCFIAFIFYLLTMQRVLTIIAPKNRTLRPGLVWLEFIPLFNLVWQFVVTIGVANSLQAEFVARGWQHKSYGKETGVVSAICSCLTFMFSIAGIGSEEFTVLDGLGIIFAIVSLVCLFVQWGQVANRKQELLLCQSGKNS